MFSSLTNVTDFAHAFGKGSKHFFSKKTLEPGGTGIYGPASYITHPSLRDHTIYTPHPRSLREDEKLPVLVWANGLSLAWGLMFGHFLREVASHGYIVIANGAPRDERAWSGVGRLRQMPASAMLDAVRWVVAAAEVSYEPDDVRAHVDGSRIALGGQSKGGLDAYEAAAALRRDEEEGESQGEKGERRMGGRVRTVGIFNSGLIFRSERLVRQVRELSVPAFFVVGGPADLAYRNAEMDWALLRGDLPAWMGNLDVGHMGTFYDDDGRGGRFGRAAVDWLDAMLKGDGEARRRLVCEYEREGWVVRSRNLG